MATEARNYREYLHVVNRSGWPRGEWDDEPDKAQWIDEATGLDCLIVRNKLGALCGYVGVDAAHPWYGIEYSHCTRRPPCEESYCGHRPDVDVHGGLTFSDFCTPHDEDAYARFLARVDQAKAEAARYPQGDAAALVARAATIHTHADYVAFAEQRHVCHVPEPGRPDRIWWFGFDCAHLGDTYPSRERDCQWDEHYRNWPYVQRQIARLAGQLAAVGAQEVA